MYLRLKSVLNKNQLILYRLAAQAIRISNDLYGNDQNRLLDLSPAFFNLFARYANEFFNKDRREGRLFAN